MSKERNFVFIATYPDGSEKEFTAYNPDDARYLAMMDRNCSYVKIRRKRESSQS